MPIVSILYRGLHATKPKQRQNPHADYPPPQLGDFPRSDFSRMPVFRHDHHTGANAVIKTMPQPNQTTKQDLGRRNLRLASLILLVAVGMLGVAFASVPLYDLFCRVTGYGGKTQISQQVVTGNTHIPRAMRFNAHVAPNLNWHFSAPKTIARLTAGEAMTVHYTATNLSHEATTGTATFNVTPFKVGPYFAKIECFCFTEQTLAPGESQDMAVTFYLDPGLDHDINTREIAEVTLSYTFFPVAK